MKTIELLSSLAFLASLASSMEIECEYWIMNWIGDIGDLYACDVIAITVENPTTVTDISGNHLPGRNNSDVKGFWYQGQETILTVTTIPVGSKISSQTWKGFSGGTEPSLRSTQALSNLFRIFCTSTLLTTTL